MEQQESHVMVLIGTHPSGVEEWYCPTCGRRFLMQWPPHYKRVILDPGDETVSHSGGKGGVVIGSINVTQNGENSGTTSSELADEHLAPWLQWMDEVDFNSMWNAPDS